jgi:hypothetical protein
MLLGALGARPASAALQVKITPVGIDEATADLYTQMVLDRPEVLRRLDRTRFRVLRADFGPESMRPDGESEKDDPQTAQSSHFRLMVYDYTQDVLTEISGDLESRLPTSFKTLGAMPEPTPEEFDAAVRVVSADPELTPDASDIAWTPYEAMPGVIDPAAVDPEHPSHERIIAVGLIAKEGHRFQHEIVGVSLSRNRVIRFPTGAPPTAIARPDACEVPSARQGVTRRGVPGSAVITIDDGDTNLWKFQVIRPSASSGRWGSGIELKNVYYKGKRLLSQAHVPVLNVMYNRNVCGPYRDWQYSESPFDAHGTLIESGILRASAPPETILESKHDSGNFRGVAVYTSGDETILMSEVQAGWYRYESEWRFHKDGTIEPRWGFSAVQDSCVCNLHFHNAYWRFDFDIGPTTTNRVQVWDGESWNDVATEARQNRGASNQKWRVIDPATGSGYEVVPGEYDGTADSFARGDAWILKTQRGELDDSRVYTGAANNISAYVNGQSVLDTDVVFWYGAHFTHSHEGSHMNDNHIVGPTLRPVNW